MTTDASGEFGPTGPLCPYDIAPNGEYKAWASLHSDFTQDGGTKTDNFKVEITSKIIVDKVTDPAEDSQLFTLNPSWDSSFQLADATTPYDSGRLDAGTHSVTETVPAGRDLTSAVCSDGSDPSAIDLDPGETVTVTFTNTKQRGHIIVDKVTDPEGDPQLFTFNPDWGSSFQLADATTPYDGGALLPGTYSVTKTVPAGWDLTSAVCSDGSDPSAIDLDPGETVTVTFTNTMSIDSGIALSKESNHPAGQVGKTIVYTYTVTNIGNVPLHSIVLEDNLLGIISGPKSGDTDGDGKLDLTETWIYEKANVIDFDDHDVPAVNHHYEITNVADVYGTSPTGGTVTDTAQATIRI